MENVYETIFKLENLSFEERLNIACQNAMGRLYLKINNCMENPIDRDGREIILGLDYNVFDSTFNSGVIGKYKATNFNKYGGLYLNKIHTFFHHVSRINQ